MFGSEVLDAAAIGAAAALLGGIVAGIFSLLTKKAEIQAKRSEIAFEKRLEAFREVYEALSKHKQRAEFVYSMVRDMNEDIDSVKWENFNYNLMESSKARDHFLEVYYKNRVFIPAPIDKKLQIYIREAIYELVHINISTEEAAARSNAILRINNLIYSEEVLSEIHKFIGFK